MGPTPILEMARAYDLRPRLWLLVAAVSGRRERLLEFDRSALIESMVVEEGDGTEADEDEEDGIRFVTLESRFESKETVLNW